ncbi:aspartyl protease family protein [Sphingomonas sp. ID0503]|uniref:aspartyl protease family protein n=1 Tax=Sphingomonas sp. ID0503 TaxID=3399691 RepID=UPI003AFB6C29
MTITAALLLAVPSTAWSAEPAVAPVTRPVLSIAEVDDKLEIGGERIDARTVRTRMTVDVHVNGRGPFRFIVDSGADTSVIGTRVAGELQLPAGTSIVLNATTGSSSVNRVRVATLRLGSSEFEDLQLPVLDTVHLGADGLIGIDALRGQRLMLDFEAQQIRVEDASEPIRPSDGEIVVTAHRRRGQLILTTARIAGQPVQAIIDTGSEVTIGNLPLRDRFAHRGWVKLPPVVVSGATGAKVALETDQVKDLRLGPVLLENVPVAFAQVPPFLAFGLDDEPALLIGTDLMSSFRRVSLDFRHRKIRFQLRRCSPQNVAIPGSDLPLSRLSAAPGAPRTCDGG